MSRQSMRKKQGKMFKRGVAMAMAVLMAASSGVVQVPGMNRVYAYTPASESTLYKDENNIQYNLLDDGTCVVRDGDEASGEVTIPSEVTYNGTVYAVIGINYAAFYGNKDITAVKIPSSVQYVGEDAFYACNNLKTVEIANGVQEIAYRAFGGCGNLKQLEIPESVVKLGYEEGYDTEEDEYYGICDSDCYLICPAGSAAESYAKEIGCKYGTASLPVTGDVLTDTKNACKVKVIKGYGSGSTVSYAGTTKSTATSITIPSTVNIDGITYKVVSIADKAFFGNKKIKKVVVNKNVTSIGKEAFANCSNLKSMEIKANSVKVGANALKGTNKNLIIKVPNGKVFAFKGIFKEKGNSKVLINSTGKALPKKNLQQLGVPFDLKKGKTVSIKVKCLAIGVITSKATVKSVKISKASKKGYKKAVIKVKWSHLLTSSEIHKTVAASVKNGTYRSGGVQYFTVADKKTGQCLEVANDFGVTTKTKSKYKKYKDNDGCWTERWVENTITITYPADYKDMCFGVGGDKNVVYVPKSDDNYLEGKIPFTQSNSYKKNKKNCHYMNIK